MTERASRIALAHASTVSSGARTRVQRLILFLSSIWAWLFLALLVLFFVVAVPLTTGGA